MLKSWEVLKRLNQMVFSILILGHKKCESNWYKSPRQHTSHSLWFISKGHGEFIINGKSHVAEPGKLFVIVPGMVYERKTDSDNPLEFYFIRFTYAEAYEEQEQWNFKNSTESEFP